jgi:hypothetical protein
MKIKALVKAARNKIEGKNKFAKLTINPPFRFLKQMGFRG